MTTLSISKIAKLSNLTLGPDEASRIEGQLTATVEYINNLQELDIADVEPTSSPSGNKNIYFEDGGTNTRTLPKGAYQVGRIL